MTKRAAEEDPAVRERRLAKRRRDAALERALRRAEKARALAGIHPENEQVGRAIDDECAALAEMLHAKNRAYGNSALDPMRVFSRATTEEQILVRLDDKLSRLARRDPTSPDDEDVELDIMGYLVLLRVGRKIRRTK